MSIKYDGLSRRVHPWNWCNSKITRRNRNIFKLWFVVIENRNKTIHGLFMEGQTKHWNISHLETLDLGEYFLKLSIWKRRWSLTSDHVTVEGFVTSTNTFIRKIIILKFYITYVSVQLQYLIQPLALVMDYVPIQSSN